MARKSKTPSNELPAIDDLGAMPVVSEELSELDSYEDWDNDPADEYTKEEIREPDAVRVTIEYAEDGGRATAKLYAHGLALNDDFSSRTEQRVLLAVVDSRGVTMFPIVSKASRDEFLSPRYGSLTAISAPANRRWVVPKTVKRFDKLLYTLPSGFPRAARFGLGLRYEYRFVPLAAADIPGVNELRIILGDGTQVIDHCLHLGTDLFTRIKKAIDSITNRASNRSLGDRTILVSNELLHRVNPEPLPQAISKAKARGAIRDRQVGRSFAQAELPR